MKHNGQGKQHLPPAQIITTHEGLLRLVERLSQESLLAIDTESNSLHAYHTRVCLIQISTRKRDFIVDPLAITDMKPLGEIFGAPTIEKVFHAAEYDLILMRREFGFEVRNLFDTMYASRLCGLTDVGLADVLAAQFEVRLDKSHQLDNWSMRPLPRDSLRYAQMDTHYLPRLRDALHHKLVALDRLDEAREVFADVLKIEARDSEFDPEGYWKIGRPGNLSRRQMAILRELYLLRDGVAQKDNRPPYKIFSNQVMIEMARNAPQTLAELSAIRGLAEWQIRVHGDNLLAAIERGQVGRVPHPPQIEMPDPVIAERYMTLHAWRKERAAQRGFDGSLILAKQTLWQIAEQMPDTLEALSALPGIGAWRLQNYGTELIELVAKMKK